MSGPAGAGETQASETGVRAELIEDAGLWHVVFEWGKGNVIGRPQVAELRRVLKEMPATARVVMLEGAGKHFSFGASVDDHLPGPVVEFLPEFHGLFRDLIGMRRPLLAVVRGQCLGGGLELAAFCHRVFAAPGAHLGQPEIKLAVFAPVASLVLPRRIGCAAAEDLLLSGRVVDAEEALRLGLVDVVADDPRQAAIEYATQAYGGLSASSLAFAVRAARRNYDREFFEGLEDVEQLYLEGLMATPDAEEGIRAFLEKRRPQYGGGASREGAGPS